LNDFCYLITSRTTKDGVAIGLDYIGVKSRRICSFVLFVTWLGFSGCFTIEKVLKITTI